MKAQTKTSKRHEKTQPAIAAADPRPQVSQRLIVAVCLALAVAILAIYGQTFTHGFVAYDDDQYVYENATVKSGLSAANIGWAMTTFFYANWHPLTWISYLIDGQIFGARPGPMHVENVLLHLASVVLLFLALLRMTGAVWRSAMVAAILAVHPLHVESVAWIAERKDVLCTFFEMATLLLYIRYTAKRSARSYAWMTAAYACSLMAKPMAVTFPFVLLLLDYWPLGRVAWPPERRKLRMLIWEKLPLAGMAIVASVLTFQAQHQSGAVAELNRLPLSSRVANAAVAYVRYLGKAFWPVDLAVLYPLRSEATEAVLGAILVLAVLTTVAVLWVRRRPYIAVGWFWYLGMLVPVIGLVQVGAQSMADRYAYLPLAGFSIALVWAGAEMVKDKGTAQKVVATAAALACIALAIVAYRQAAYWHDSHTLYEHTLAVTDNNYIVENNLGVVLLREGDSAGASAHFRRSMAQSPDYGLARANLGHTLLQSGRIQEAEPLIREAIRLSPRDQAPRRDLGVMLAAAGQWEQARAEMEEALRHAPQDVELHSNLCYVLQHMGRVQDAIARCREALRINPDFVDARYNLGTALSDAGNRTEAVAELSRVLSARPDHSAARLALENLSRHSAESR